MNLSLMIWIDLWCLWVVKNTGFVVVVVLSTLGAWYAWLRPDQVDSS